MTVLVDDLGEYGFGKPAKYNMLTSIFLVKIRVIVYTFINLPLKVDALIKSSDFHFHR